MMSAPRRIPFIQSSGEPEASTPEVASESWMEKTVAEADAGALPQLEKLALRNNRRALEAIALLADQDQAGTLTRVWRSGALTPANQAVATRYLAATMELNPEAELILRGLVADANTDTRLLYSAVDGLSNPSFPVSFGRVAPIPPPPHFKPDYGRRMRVLDNLRSAFTDETARAYADQARADLQTRSTESNSNAP